MTRWWGVALLSLSVGLNLGLAIAVVQQRFAPSPAATPGPEIHPDGPGIHPDAPEAHSEPPPAPTPTATPVGPAPSTLQPVGPEWATPVARGREPAPPASPPGTERRPVPGDENREPARGGDLTWTEGPGEGVERERPGLEGPPPGGLRGGGPSPAKLEEVAQRLGVPPEDRPRFIALQRAFLGEARLRRIELEGVRRLLQAELVSPRPDRQRLRELVESSARLQARLEDAFIEHVLAARELLDGEAERRYLQFLSRLGPRVMQGGPPGGPGRQGDPRWQPPGRKRPWVPGGGQMRRRDRWPETLPEQQRPAPTSPEPPPSHPAREGSVLQAFSDPPSFGAR